jgi:hypothetical protein
MTRYVDPDGLWAMTVPMSWAHEVDDGGEGPVGTAFLISGPQLPGRWADDPDVDSVVVTVLPGLTPTEAVTMWVSLGDGPPISERSTTLAGRTAQEVLFDARSAARRGESTLSVRLLVNRHTQ